METVTEPITCMVLTTINSKNQTNQQKPKLQ